MTAAVKAQAATKGVAKRKAVKAAKAASTGRSSKGGTTVPKHGPQERGRRRSKEAASPGPLSGRHLPMQSCVMAPAYTGQPYLSPYICGG